MPCTGSFYGAQANALYWKFLWSTSECPVLEVSMEHKQMACSESFYGAHIGIVTIGVPPLICAYKFHNLQ